MHRGRSRQHLSCFLLGTGHPPPSGATTRANYHRLWTVTRTKRSPSRSGGGVDGGADGEIIEVGQGFGEAMFGFMSNGLCSGEQAFRDDQGGRTVEAMAHPAQLQFFNVENPRGALQRVFSPIQG